MRNKEITEIKKIVAAWYADNTDVYAAFREMVDKAISEGDMKFYEEMVAMLKSFIPDDIMDETEEGIKELVNEMEKEQETDGEVASDNAEIQEEDISAIEDLTNNEDFAKDYDEMVMEMRPQIEAVENVIAEKIRTKDSMVFCYYYWMLFENGPTELVTMYSNHLKRQNVPIILRWILKKMFQAIVKKSFLMGARKTDWRNYLKKESEADVKNEVSMALEESKVAGGKRVDCSRLDELIDNPKVIEKVGLVVKSRKSDVDIAYILMNLRNNCLIPDIAYTTFHRALQNAFPDARIKGYGKAQAKYAQLRRLYGLRSDVPCSIPQRKQLAARLRVELLDKYFKAFSPADEIESDMQ